MAKATKTTTMALPRLLQQRLCKLKLVPEEKLSSVVERLVNEYEGNRQ